ncbi:MAG: insulinase family protein [Bacteroidetes bacterium]|nr:insulinase family protein [Bacteroidota bacterium]
MTTPYQIHQFPNGIRLVHRRTKSKVAHFGVVINAGSRDELPHEQGLAHFIEHMIFKGTEKRSANQVINRLDNVGADMNAFTTKEETCVYASFLEQHYPKAIELLSDIIFHSQFPEKEILKEKAVVNDEINSYKDNPAEWIHDEFDKILFPDHALGKNILGTPAHLKKFSRFDIQQFIARQYSTQQIVLSSVGNVPFDRIKLLAEKYFGDQPQSPDMPLRFKPTGYSQQSITRKFGRHQAHLLMGNLAFDQLDEQRYPMALLNNLLGGPAMNSRLNLALREKHGIAYNLESNYQPLSDTGIFTIYLGTDEKMVGKAQELVNKELEKLRSTALGFKQMKTAREQLKGQLAISMESNQNEMVSIGKSILVFDKVDTLEDIHSRLDKVTAGEILEVANHVFDPAKLSLLIFNNLKG